MKHYYLLIICLLFLGQNLSSRDRVLLNEGWRFKKLDSTEINHTLDYKKIKQWVLPSGNKFLVKSNKPQKPTGNLDGGKYAQYGYDDSSWRQLNLPHDWGIEGPFVQEYPGETAKLPWFGISWYRKNLDINASDAGKQFYLDVDGAMSFSTIWCNGHFVGGWPYGYASYRIDLTPYIKAGEKNVIAIRLDNPDESSRWYPGGGIYRNIWLTTTNPVSIAQWGTFITATDISKEKATLNLKMNIDNVNSAKDQINVKTEIYNVDKQGNPTGKPLVIDNTPLKLSGKESQLEKSLTLKQPILWDIDNPHLYVASITLLKNGKAIDTYNTVFGVRTIEFKANDGFHLNGRRVRLQGVCMHHDLGALGAAFNYRAMERQLEILQEMGVNAIRTSHNPPAPEMLDLCDKMGFLVIDEFIDTWVVPKKKNGYAILFNDWHEQDLRAFMQRDRNHPSIIMWSTGNEVGEQGSADGIRISNLLTSIIHEEDPSRPATIGCDNPNAAFNGFENTTDIFGFNYKPHLYSKFSADRPNILFYGSETASCISTRGEYLFPVDDDKSGGKIGFQMSSYDLYAPDWASPPDTEFKGQDQAKANAGEFVWTGFDYLGEPTPFTRDLTVLTNYHDPIERAKAEQALKEMGKIEVPSRSSYFGIVDLAGFKKDRFYIYQARWRPDLPMAHILPHWNWSERIGQVTPVHVYTSGDSAELFLNGKSLGKKIKGEYEYRLRWDDVVYEPGVIEVVAYKDNKVWASDKIKTSGDAYQLKVEADRNTMKADGQDLIYVTVEIKDKNGLFVPRANNLVQFELSGNGEIVATDNGDPTSHEPFQNKNIKAFNGKCLVIIRSIKGQAGNIQLKAISEGLKNETINLKSID